MSVPTTDSAAIKQIIDGLTTGGCTLMFVFDGEEEYPVSTRAEAVRHITDVDMAHLHVRLPDESTGWVWFVLGNDPEEVAADCTVNLSPYIDPVVDPWWE